MTNFPFQRRVQDWMMECFSMEVCRDHIERNHRFLEEALELVQACGCTASEAHQLVDYVWGRPVGEPTQEVGGVMVTLAALCLANDYDMHEAGETELERVWTKIEQIRAKQAAKPKHSPLPIAPAHDSKTDAGGVSVKAETWHVTVYVNGADILNLGHNHLSGADDIERFTDAIRNCAHHLLAFIGDPAPIQRSDAETEGLRAAVIEECAKVAESEAQAFLSPQYAANQPFGSICERFACEEVAKAIRALAPNPAAGSAEQPRCTCQFVKDDYGAPQIKICETCSHPSADREAGK